MNEIEVFDNNQQETYRSIRNSVINAQDKVYSAVNSAMVNAYLGDRRTDIQVLDFT